MILGYYLFGQFFGELLVFGVDIGALRIRVMILS